MSKKGNPLHGWLVLDKPAGLTSTQALGRVKRLLRPLKAGHAGTLDPLATGVLPIALGEATKTVPFAVDGPKSYTFTVRWGVETTTDDAEGSAAKTSARRPADADVIALLPAFTGAISQVPPQFSAVKIGGERAYDLARAGGTVDIAAREVEISRLELVEQASPDLALFEADCGKGTYVRSLARDMGRVLGCFGHVTALRRTRVGPFAIADAIGFADIEARLEAEPNSARTLLQPVEAALADLPAISLGSSDAALLARGQRVLVRGRDAPISAGMAYATCRGVLIALVEWREGCLEPVRVFRWT